jgi:alanine-glyoxylate transaminase/serine-glyoxylate transaminase/serine-pyruvate transaminase
MGESDRILMGPGPCNPYPEVISAFTRPVLGHLDPEFLALLDETNARLRTAFRTDNALTFPISATGSAGMEACFVNLVERGAPVVIGVNGVFGARMCDVASRCGAVVTRVEAPWGQPIEPERLLEAHPSPSIIAVVHAETSVGVRNDVAALGEGKGDALLLVDCVTSLGGIEVDVDGWGIDAVYSGTQKCLGVPPGLAPVSFSDRARERFVPSQSWYLDASMIADYVESKAARSYHHTAPISMIYGLHAGLGVLLDEGLEASWARHSACGERLQAGLEQRGMKLFASEGHRLPELTTVWVPDGVDEAAVRRSLLTDYGIEIGGGLGEFVGRVWRIGCMGHTARRRNVDLLLAALDDLVG